MALPVVSLLLAAGTMPTANSKDEVEFGINAARRGLWSEARFRFEKAVALGQGFADAHNRRQPRSQPGLRFGPHLRTGFAMIRPPFGMADDHIAAAEISPPAASAPSGGG